MIVFDSVSKSYAGQPRPALSQVSLTIARGEFAFLVGASGSGKTTCLRLILRETRATEGRILVDGMDVTRLQGWRVPRLRRRIGVVFQDFRLLPGMTVAENVAFALEVTGASASTIRRLVPETLDLVGLRAMASRLPEELSGGEQQRVALARAYVNRPPLILADEPTGNLDPTSSLAIMRLLDRIHQAGTTVLVATHDAGIVDQLRRRVLELDAGRLVRDQARGVYGRL